MGHRARSHASAAARQGSRTRRRCRRTWYRCLLAGDERSVLRAQRRDRRPRDPADRPDREDLRSQGPTHHPGRASRGRWDERVGGGQQRSQLDAGDGERRDRRDRVHRVDLRVRRRRRSPQRGPARQTEGRPRAREGPPGVGRRHALRRSGGADDDHHDLRLRPVHRRPGDGIGRARRRLDRGARPAADPDAFAERCGHGRRHRCASGQAGIELLGGQPEALELGEHLGGDGPAARLLLPGDRPADPPQRPGHRGPGRRGAGHGDVHPDRPHQGLRVEPDLREPRRTRRLRREALRTRRLSADPRDGPLPVPGGVPTVRRVRCRHAERDAHPVSHVGTRPGHRHGNRRRTAVTRSRVSDPRSAATVSTWPR